MERKGDKRKAVTCAKEVSGAPETGHSKDRAACCATGCPDPGSILLISPRLLQIFRKAS